MIQYLFSDYFKAWFAPGKMPRFDPAEMLLKSYGLDLRRMAALSNHFDKHRKMLSVGYNSVDAHHAKELTASIFQNDTVWRINTFSYLFAKPIYFPISVVYIKHSLKTASNSINSSIVNFQLFYCSIF